MANENPAPKTVLWISAHPEPRSLTGALRRDGIARLRELGHEVIESDLYAMEWDPVLRPQDGGRGRGRGPGHENGIGEADEPFRVSEDTRRAFIDRKQPPEVQAEQDKLRRADAVVLQFPLWWYGMPAMLKGWFDRVFVSGFAFGTDPESGRRLRFEQGPFVGKRALVVTTLGDRPLAIGPRGKSGELHELLFGLLHGTLAYTGMSALPPWALPSADRISEYGPVRESLQQRLDRLFLDEPIPYRPQFTGEYTSEWELAPHILPEQHGLRINVGG